MEALWQQRWVQWLQGVTGTEVGSGATAGLGGHGEGGKAHGDPCTRATGWGAGAGC